MTDEVVDLLQARQNNTVAGVIGPVLDEEHNVDDANRAVELSRTTGVPSTVIYPNVKEYDKQNQTAMISQLLRQDEHLRNFADSDPIVPKIATNDWGSLAKASKSMAALAINPIAFATTKEGQEVWKSFLEGAKEGFGIDSPYYVTEEGIKNLDWAKKNVLLWTMFYYGGGAVETLLRGTSAAVSGTAKGIGKAAEQLLGPEAGEKVEKGIHVAAEYAMTDIPAMQALHARQMRFEYDKARLAELKEAAYKGDPWIKAGEEPPVGVHPFIDELKKAKVKDDLRKLDDAISDFDAIPLKKSAPEILANLPRSHTDKEIGISAEAVRKLYGDTKPEADDGKLGWVPDLESKLRAAELSNGDVSVPLAEYVARVDKAVHDELKEDIRFSEAGMTVKESKEPIGRAADIEAPEKQQPTEFVQQEPNEAAIGAVKDQGDFKPLLDRGGEPFKEAEWKSIGLGAEAKVPDTWTPVHDKIIQAVGDYLGQVLPDKLEGHIPALSIREGTRKVSGLYTEYRKQKPIIFWALDAPDVFGTVRHEVIHALRRGGHITEKEWNVLSRAVRDEQLIDLYNIDERYPDLPMEGKIEEAVAEHFKYWDRTSKEIKSGPVKEIFAKLKRIKDGVYNAIAKVWGKEPSVHEIFGAIESGEVGQREGKSITPGAFGSAADVGAIAGESVEEKAMAKAKAFGLTEKELKLYAQKIAKQNDENAEWMKKRAIEEETRKQTREWKDEEKAVRQEVLSDAEKMPDLVADNYFRNGEYLGQKLTHKPKIDPAGLSDYEKRALPKGITAPGGADPDIIAGMLGFKSGKEMLQALQNLEYARGELSMGEFIKQKLDEEVARRMEERHGDLAENILAEAREHVLSQTQFDIMHQETLAMATKAGAEFTFTLEDVKGWIKDEFEQAWAGGVKASRYISEAGRAGRRMEKALLEEKFGEAFKEAQHRQFAALLAKEAAKFEKEVKRNEKIMSRFQRRPNIKSIAQPYTDQAQGLILTVGEPIRRTQENLQLSLQGKTFEEFRNERNAMGDGILDPMLTPGKKFEQFSVDEFRNFAAALKSLDYNGRKAKVIEKENEALAHEFVIEGISENLDNLAKEGFDPTKGRVRKAGRWLDAKLVKAEQLIDWIDDNDPRGWFNQTTSRILFAAQHQKGDMIADLAQMFKKIPVDRAWGRNLDARVENKHLLNDAGQLATLTNENKIAIALNFGNKSNRSVLLRGHNWKLADVQQFLNETMTKMDWDFVKGVWEVFDKIGPLVEEATTKRSGVPIEMVQKSWFDTPHGRMEGGYYPLIKDSREALLGEQRKTDLVDKPFFDPLPMARAMNLRTGVAYPLDLTLQQMAGRINETVHAAIFQDPIRNAKKVIDDPTVRKGIDKAFGPEYVKELDNWLKDIANNGGERDDWTWISRNLRENVVFGLMGYKLSTAAIHALSAGVSSAYEVGPLHLAKNLKRLGIAQVMPDVARKFFANSDQMWEQIDWAQETFPELRNRMQVVGRDMQAQIGNIVRKGFFDDAARIRAANIVWSMKMVATLDQLTATPVAIAAYTKAISEGTSHADAVYIGDKAVRQAHGSPSLVGRANIGRGEVQKWLTVAYNGYWNHNYNRTRTAVRDVKNPDIEFSTRLIVGSAALTAFIIAPALVHYGIRGSENSSWTGAISEALLSQFGGQVPVVNSLTHALMHNRDPHVSPADDVLKHATDVQKDIVAKLNGGKAEKFVRHVLETPGFFLGIGASSQIATAIQFQVDVAKRKEVPESIFDWARGTVTGHTKSNTPRHR